MKPLASALLFLTILLAASIAGCVEGTGSGGASKKSKRIEAGAAKVWDLADPILSQPIFTEVVKEPLPFVASDGAKLDSWLWRPVAPEGQRFPVIMHMSPYYGNSLPDLNSGTIRMMNENFTKRGYVVIGTSVRGTGFSEGCFEIGGPRERQDYVELFNHIAEQPWSTGEIGLIGVSYDGTAPQGALVTGSPHLKTIVPIAAISEWYKYNFVKGVQINPQGWAFNTYYVALEQAPYNFHTQEWPVPVPPLIPPPPDPTYLPTDAQTYATRACIDQGSGNPSSRGPSVVDVQRAQFATAATGTTDPYWEDRNFTAMLDKVRENVSVFVVHGLIDYNVKTHNLLPWYTALKDHDIPTKIQLGQWGHAYPGTTRPNGREDWNLTLLRWFDYWLKGIPTGIMDEPEADIQDFSGVWRTEETWPPERASPTTYYFDASGDLKMEPGAGESMFVDNGQPFNDAAPVAETPNAVSFTGPLLTETFRYSGAAVATVKLTHTTPRGQIAVTVYNVTGDQWQPVNWGFYNYNIRNDPATYDPVVPGEEFTLRIPLLPTDMVIEKGSRIGVVFSGANSGGPGMLPPPSGGATTLIHGEGSNIMFPALDGIVPLDPQPKMLGRDPNQIGS